MRALQDGSWAVAGLVLSVGFVYFVSNSNQQNAGINADLEVGDGEVLSEPFRGDANTVEPAQVVVQDAS